MQLYIEENEMENICKTMKTLIREMEDLLNELDRIVISLGMQWQGEAEQSYTIKLLRSKKEYRKIIQFFELFENSLEEILRDYTEWEKKNMAHIQNI